MQTIPLTLATSGMSLARDILREDGIILCGKGTVLSEALIERLKRLGVQTITVEGHPIAEEGEKTQEEELADLEERFRPRAGDPLLMRVKEIIKDLIVTSWQ
ncbi:MAG: hypothetical protein RDU59_01745 [Thermodesulfobacteriota bacterium]|nr:hypothetical protein [Thermodesulfobacteriota bacterium]